MKFKIGDRVVAHGSVFATSGRPKVRVIEKIYPPNESGTICYGGKFWKAKEENLTLESEFAWPSELEMRIMDKKRDESFEEAFTFVAEHEDDV